MIVNELVAWLLTQDQGAIVEVLEHKCGTGYYDQGGNTRIVTLDLKLHAEYYDYDSKAFLLFGAMNA